MMDEIRFGSERDELPPGAVRAALRITQAVRLVRQTRHGFSITDLGREVQKRVEPRGGVVYSIPRSTRNFESAL
jgi:hypothetical protein